MNKGYKVQIFPNEEQKKLMFKSFGCSRFAYNWALNKQQENYKNSGKFINDGTLRKEFTQLKKQEDFKWLSEVNNNVTKQAIKDLCKAYKAFFKGNNRYPNYKSKKKSKQSFYNDIYKIKFDGYRVKLETIGWIDMAEDRIPKDCKYQNPRISFDGINFWLSISCVTEESTINNPNKTEPIGIDLGIKTLMVCSNGMNFKRVKMKKQNKKLRRFQRRASRYYDRMMKTKSSIKSKNLQKLEALILKHYKKNKKC